MSTESEIGVIDTLHGRRVAFLAPHDEGHRLLPGELPAHANIYALKQLGVQRVIAFSAVGLLQQHIEPLHEVVPDEIIDRTRGRHSSGHGDIFFGDGIVARIGFADPFCPDLGARIADAGDGAGATVHRGGTLIVIGDRRSPPARSRNCTARGARRRSA